MLYHSLCQTTVKPVFKTTLEIGTAWELRTATWVPGSIHYIEMDLRNTTTSEFRAVFDSPLGVPNSQVPLYYYRIPLTDSRKSSHRIWRWVVSVSGLIHLHRCIFGAHTSPWVLGYSQAHFSSRKGNILCLACVILHLSLNTVYCYSHLKYDFDVVAIAFAFLVPLKFSPTVNEWCCYSRLYGIGWGRGIKIKSNRHCLAL